MQNKIINRVFVLYGKEWKIMEFVSGYTDEAKYCPFCGDRIYIHTGDGRNICENENCRAEFYMIEAEESMRQLCEMEE